MINHIEHLEDLILTQGVVGGMKTLNYLWSIQHGNAQISTKWDGAPSIFAGWDEQGFFVSTKAFLSKKSVRYYTYQQINESNLVDELKGKLIHCLHYLDRIVPRGVILQGDLLFAWPSELEEVDGYTTFQPNTIVYGVPSKWWKGDKLQGWKIGVVWHTWIAASGDVSHPHFGKLLTDSQVLSIDPTVSRYSIDEDLTTDVRLALDKVDHDFVALFKDNSISQLIQRAYNARVRGGFVENFNAEDLYRWVDAELVRGAMELLTERGRQARLKQADQIKAVLGQWPKMNAVLNFQEAVRTAKRKAINSLNDHSRVATWVKTDDGLVPTAHEGYVVFGHNESVKLVDRQQFSHFNFNANYIKGWDAPTRT